MTAKSKTEDRAAPSVHHDSASQLSSEMEAFAGDPDFMMSLARGLAVIRAFSADHTRLTVAQASERIGLPRSAVRRCLYTLQCLGYLGVEGSSFFLKPRILALGHAHLMDVPLAVSAQPVLDSVAKEVGETCTLAVLDDEDIVFVGHSSKVPLLSVNITVGSRLPAHCTANGRVLLAALPPAELETYFAKLKFSRLTSDTLAGKKQLRERIEQVRQNGYALVDQEFDVKVRSIAVPVRQAGRVVASMSIAVPSDRVSIAELQSRCLPVLRVAATEFA